jgi:hypothetical protein
MQNGLIVEEENVYSLNIDKFKVAQAEIEEKAKNKTTCKL